MSDSIVRLRIDSKEYDANIKRAGQALTEYFNKVREGGGTLMHLDEGVMETVKAMGDLGTQATSAKGSLRELTQATTDMTVSYRALTDEEKNSPLGQAMQRSIQQMTERAGNMKDALGDVGASIKNAASDTRVFDQLAGGAQLMTAGFQTAVGTMQLFGAETEDNIAVLTTLQATMGIVNGLQTIQNTLQKESAVMQGIQSVQTAAAAAAQTTYASATGAATIAQKALNVVANANPYVLLASAVIAVGTALYAFASASDKAKQEAEELAKKEEEAAKRSEDARNSFVNASAEALNSASRLSSLQVAYKQANSEMEKTGVLKQAQQEFKKLGFECKGVDDAYKLLITNGAKVIELIQLQGNAAAISAIRMEKFKESMNKILENRQAEKGFFDTNDIQYAANLAGAAVGDFDKALNNLQGRIQSLKSGLGMGSGSGGGRGKSTTKQDDRFEADSIMAQEKWISQLEDQWKRAGAAVRDEYIPMIEMAKEKLEEMKSAGKEVDPLKLIEEQFPDMSKQNYDTGYSKSAKAKADSALADFAQGGISTTDISDFINATKSALQEADLGSDLFNSLTEQLKDATTMSTLLNELMERGVSGADLTTVAEQLKASLLDGDIPDDKIQEFIEKINEQIREQGGVELSLNGQTGEVSEKKDVNKEDGFKEFTNTASKLTGGLSDVANGLKALGVDIPKEFDEVFGVINGASQIISGVGSIISLVSGGALATNTAAVGLNTGAILGLTTALEVNSAINAIPFFAGGGVVGRAASGLLVGSHSSGDNLRMPISSGGFLGINDGELILNKAQQGNIASMLEGAGGVQGYPEVRLSGEDIFVVLNNYLSRNGYGEIVTSK